jgi:hypothetical protein
MFITSFSIDEANFGSVGTYLLHLLCFWVISASSCYLQCSVISLQFWFDQHAISVWRICWALFPPLLRNSKDSERMWTHAKHCQSWEPCLDTADSWASCWTFDIFSSVPWKDPSPGAAESGSSAREARSPKYCTACTEPGLPVYGEIHRCTWSKR